MASYTVGVDFGTQSVRAVVVNTENGASISECTYTYPHGVMDRVLPDGTPLHGPDWALADPADYLEGLKAVVRGAVESSGLPADNIGALAIAATACTILPVDASLTPLCFQERFRDHPQAWCKLWKHHRAQPYATAMTKKAEEMKLPFLADYGGKISSEWAIPKIMEVYEEDREVYDAADRFMQFSDWLTAWAVGDPEVQNGSIATYKALWDPETGFPDNEYLAAVGPQVPDIVCHKLRGHRYMAGDCAGTLTPEAAGCFGLTTSVKAGIAHTDAHTSAYGSGIAGEGDYVFIIGTSSCGHLVTEKKVNVPGVTGALKNSLLRGYTCYSAGQACVGDMLEWFIRTSLPEEEKQKAAAQGISVHQYLEQEAQKQRPSECGLITLDWFNGNRSTLVNASLSGMTVGLTMETSPTDIYRSMLDAIAFGHREITDNFYEHGLNINRIIICGGIAHKNDLLMQIMADVLGRPIQISAEPQATALGAAMCAAAALGSKDGGYDTLPDAIRHMQAPILRTVEPDPENTAAYEKLYRIYRRMYRLFGTEMPEIMEELRVK